jgi:hypothetical protein
MYKVAEAIKDLPSNWDMLYLGISPTQKCERFSPHLFKVRGGYTTHAIIWNNRHGGAVEYMLKHRKEIMKIDVFISSIIHKIFKCFVIFPILCTQNANFHSDTCRRSDISTIIKNYNKNCV